MPDTSRVFQVRHTCGTKDEVVKQVATRPRRSSEVIGLAKGYGVWNAHALS